MISHTHTHRHPVSSGHRRRTEGFTLLELLTVMGIIALLAGLLVPALAMIQTHVKKTMTRDRIQQIEAAWQAHLIENRKFSVTNPAAVDSMTPQVTMELNLVGVRGVTRREEMFVETDELELLVRKNKSSDWSDWRPEGTGILDAWGIDQLRRAGIKTIPDLTTAAGEGFDAHIQRRLRLMLDADGDGLITAPDGTEVNQSVLVWSVGRDGIDNTGDEIYSWK